MTELNRLLALARPQVRVWLDGRSGSTPSTESVDELLGQALESALQLLAEYKPIVEDQAFPEFSHVRRARRNESKTKAKRREIYKASAAKLGIALIAAAYPLSSIWVRVELANDIVTEVRKVISALRI